jgi:hypothetical protein
MGKDKPAKVPRKAPVRRNKGRKTILTPDMIQKLTLMIQSGAYIETACKSVGISQAAYFKWIQKGEAEVANRADEDDPVVDKTQQPYVDFIEALARAEGLAELNAMNRIREIATATVSKSVVVDGKKVTISAVDPRIRLDADKFFLERRYRDRWGRSHQHTGNVDVTAKGKVEVEHTGNTPITFNVPVPEGMKRIHDLDLLTTDDETEGDDDE